MKMLCDYCDKRNKCTKIISNKLCLEFAHKLSFIEISDSKEVYSLSDRVEWHYPEYDVHTIYLPYHYMIDGSNAFEIKMYDDFGNKYIYDEFIVGETNWFFNKDDVEAVANILNSCRG